MKLSNIILTEDYLKYKEEAKKLENELRDTYNRDDIHVNMGAYSGGRADNDKLRDKGYGKVTFMTKEELPPEEWKNLKNYLEAKNFEITDESNWFDSDEDRNWYPNLKFEFDV